MEARINSNYNNNPTGNMQQELQFNMIPLE